MKSRVLLLMTIALIVSEVSCKKDNYSPPDTYLKGRIVYKGEPINVAYNDVTFQLWQPGWGKLTPINVTVDQDGSYSALLFKGNYKLVFSDGAGPFIPTKDKDTGNDTIYINLQSNMQMDIDVLPYYMIRNARFSVNITDSIVSASCSIEKIITDSTLEKDIEYISLYISKTNWVDGRTSINSATLQKNDINDINNIELKVKIPNIIPTQHYVFARIGLKIKNVGKMIYSNVQEIDF